MIKIIFFIVFSILTFHQLTLAQFDADVRKGCAPLTVTLTSNITGEDVQIKYDFDGDETDLTLGDQNSHTYTEPGIYSIHQIIQIGNSSASEHKEEGFIEVVEPVLPQFTITPCSGFQANIKITDSFYDFYLVDFGDGTIETVGVGTEIVTHAYADNTPHDINVKGGFTDGGNDFCGEQTQNFIPQLNINPGIVESAQVISDSIIELDYELPDNVTYILQESVGGNNFIDLMELDNVLESIQLPGRGVKNEAYCYRIISRDVCVGDEIISNEICVVDIEVTAEQGLNLIQWPNIPALSNFEKINVYVDDSLTNEIQNINQNEFEHTDVTCNEEYCYQLEIIYNNGVTATSNKECVIAIADFDLPEIESLNASVDGQNIEISYSFSNVKRIKSLEILRSENGGEFTSLQFDEFDFNNFTDSSVNVNANQYCYMVLATDFCDNVSTDSTVVCPVLLSGEKINDNNDLTWTNFVGFPFGFSYSVEILDEQGEIIDTVEGLARNVLNYSDFNDPNESNITGYRIKVVADHDNTLISHSNIFVFIDELVLNAPEAFTPNNDGLNDTFFLRGQLITEYEMKIFTRWGELIYITQTPDNGWDGTINGKEAPAGPYSFLVKAKDIIGNETEKKGLFLLIR